ncbi:MAG: sugar ABC transporter substrate-binding protein, partial [Spirochaetes bacterium]|nr:sugar ABC transporter substrate-binding protein [Spirochaetota bacterium]
CVPRKEGKIESEITYFSRGEPVLLEIWQTVSEKFMEKNPDVKVNIENVDYELYWSKLLTMIAAGTPPDVIFLESNRMTSYITKGSLTDLTPFIEKDEKFRIEDFFNIAISPYMRNGRLFGLPNDVATVVMFYNKNLFDEAGLPYPNKNWTWADMLKIAKKLTRDIDNNGKIDQYGLAYYPHEIAIPQNGGSRFDNAENPTRCMLNAPAAKEAIQFCNDLSHKYKVSPTMSDFQDTDGRTMFVIGRIAMIPDGHWMVPRFKKEINKFKWDVVVLPRKKQQAGSGRGSGFAIPSGSKNKEAAFRFIKFVTGFEGQKILMKAGFSMPALKTIAKSVHFQNPPPENKQAFIDMTKAAVLEPKLESWNEVQDMEDSELDRIWVNEEKAETVLKRLAKNLNKIIQKK